MYLQRLGKSEQEVRDLVREEAEHRLRRSLVLSKFADAENIEVEELDVDAELENMSGTAGDQADAIRQIFGSENGRDTLRRSLLSRKTLARLVEIASGAPGAADTSAEATKEAEPAEKETAEPDEEKPAPKQRRSGPRQSE